MRLPLSTLEIFTAIAQEGSFKGAADALGIKPSTVSHQLKTLEDRLETTLFIRTTRSVSLTEAGRALLRGAGPAFDQLAEAVESARTTGHAARGRLKLALPEFAYHMLIGPVLHSFCQAYPEIELELSQTDAFADLLGEELHAGFRLGDRIAQDMVAVRLSSPLPLAVFASPEYIRENGMPEHPRDLLRHKCVRYRFQSSGKIAPWEFVDENTNYSAQVTGNLIVNTLPASMDIARQGLALAYTFRDYGRQELEDGRLITVLDRHLGSTPGIYIYFPREYRSMMPLRLLLEHLKANVKG